MNVAMMNLAEEAKWELMEFGAAVTHAKLHYEEAIVRWKSWIIRTDNPKRKAIYQTRVDLYTEWLAGIIDWPEKIRKAITELPGEN